MILKGKKVLVVGLGKSGLAAVRLLKKKKAHVFVSDERPRKELINTLRLLPAAVRVEVGNQSFLKKSYDLVVISPGVPWDLPALKRFRKMGIPVWPELELGWRFVNPKTTIAITGTNGKTTTTAMVGHILQKARLPTVVGGNIGVPLSGLTSKIKKNTYLVLEVSSYQLEAHTTFSPNVGVILNLTPDHLARHKTMKNYGRIKARLFVNSIKKDVAILNHRSPEVRRMGKWIFAKKVWFPSAALKKIAKNTVLLGTHNLENAMAATAACLAVGVPQKRICLGIRSFKGVPHRLQIVRQIKGITFINDSKATNVDSTYMALKASHAPTFLILGGLHKGSSYKPLVPLIKRKVVEVLTIGQAENIIRKDLKNTVPIRKCNNLETAVQFAFKQAKKGNQILLSPACASFDQYLNFEKRGDHFIRLVNGLKT